MTWERRLESLLQATGMFSDTKYSESCQGDVQKPPFPGSSGHILHSNCRTISVRPAMREDLLKVPHREPEDSVPVHPGPGGAWTSPWQEFNS